MSPREQRRQPSRTGTSSSEPPKPADRPGWHHPRGLHGARSHLVMTRPSRPCTRGWQTKACALPVWTRFLDVARPTVSDRVLRSMRICSLRLHTRQGAWDQPAGKSALRPGGTMRLEPLLLDGAGEGQIAPINVDHVRQRGDEVESPRSRLLKNSSTRPSSLRNHQCCLPSGWSVKVNLTTQRGVRPWRRTDLGCCFDHLPGVVVLELGGAQIAEGWVEPPRGCQTR